jgi:nucleotide-binding universal stress UspA family protein
MDENNSNNIFVNRILVATDGSASSIRAANFAIHLCKLEKAELVILHVLPDIKQGGVIGLRAKYGDLKMVSAFLRAKTLEANKWIEPIEKNAKRNGVSSKTVILENDGSSIVGIITKYAKKNQIDLITVGSRGLSKFKHLLVGSVTSAITSHSHCPVVLVK